jgi:hypothetical protein
LPGLDVDDEWFEPMGVAAMIVEALYIVLYAYVMTQSAPAVRLTETSRGSGVSATWRPDEAR